MGALYIAATNRLESLDEAVIRSGRLSKHIEILLPDKSLREKILGLYTEKVPMAPDVNLAKLAEETNGFSGADLENLVNEAKLHAVDQICEEESEDEELKVTVNMDDFNNVLKDLKSKKVEVKNENEAVNDFIEFCKNISKCTSSSKDSSYLYQFSLLTNQIRSIAELFNCGRGKRGNKFTQSALKQNNRIVDFIA